MEQQAASWYLRRFPRVGRTCKICGASFIGTPKRRRCPACIQEKRYSAKKTKPSLHCVVCGKLCQNTGPGPHRRTCSDACRSEKMAARKKGQKKNLLCQYCGEEFRQRSRKKRLCCYRQECNKLATEAKRIVRQASDREFIQNARKDFAIKNGWREDLLPVAVMILNLLARKGMPLTAMEIGKELSLKYQSFGRYISELRRRGLLIRFIRFTLKSKIVTYSLGPVALTILEERVECHERKTE